MAISSDRLDRLANYCVILAAIVFAGSWTWYATRPKAAVAVPPAIYRPGDSLKDFAELKSADSRPVLLLFVSSTCHFCDESMPFYQKMLQADGIGNRRVVIAGREEISSLRSHLQEKGLPLDRAEFIQVAEDSAFKANLTPSLFLVASDRLVEQAWIGKMKPDGQETLLNWLAHPKAGS